MELKIEIVNLKEIREAFSQSPAIISKHTNIAIKRSILDIKNGTVDTTPKRTSRLVGSFQVGFKNLYGEIYPTAKYAYWVHEGSGIYVGHQKWKGKIPGIGWRWIRGQKANPYLKNAIVAKQDKINRNFEQGLSDAFDEIAAKGNK